MQPYKDLVELAKICIVQARQAKTKKAAQKLRRMAEEYQNQAAALQRGKHPTHQRERSGVRSLPSTRTCAGVSLRLLDRIDRPNLNFPLP